MKNEELVIELAKAQADKCTKEECTKDYDCGICEAEFSINFLKQKLFKGRPKIVCLCGSTRFGKEFYNANCRETLAGNIILTIGCNMKSDTELFGHLSDSELKAIKTKLDELHKRKIDLADEVLILNVGGYIGTSTRSELEYAKAHNKIIRYLEAIEDKREEWEKK